MIVQSYKKIITGQVITIFFIQAIYSTVFAFFYSGLSLFLTHNKAFTQQSASLFTGIFLSLNYFLPLIGGVIATRYISYKNLFLLGMFFSCIGCIFLVKDYIYLGLSFFLMGALSNICINIFLTQMFSDNEKTQRRTAFIWNYVGMNLGFMLGYFLSGLSTLNSAYYPYLFMLMSVFIILSICVSAIFLKEPILHRKMIMPGFYQIIVGTLIIGFLISLTTAMFFYSKFLHGKITLFTIITVCMILYSAFKKTDHNNRNHFLKFISFLLLTIVFWTLYMLTPIVMMQFIENNVERHYFNIVIAPQWLTNLNSIFILIFAPLLTLLMKHRKTFDHSETYFIVGFILLFIGFLLMTMGIHFTTGHAKIPALVMIGYLILLAFGEIFISPISDSFVGEYIQESSRGLMTGISRVTICIGVLLAGILANHFILPHLDKGGFTSTSRVKLEHFFLVCGLVSLFIASTIPIILSMIRHTRENVVNKSYT